MSNGEEKVFLGNGKVVNGPYGDFFKIGINMRDAQQFVNEGGWLNLIMSKRREVSDKGVTHYLYLDTYVPNANAGGVGQSMDQQPPQQLFQGQAPAQSAAPQFAPPPAQPQQYAQPAQQQPVQQTQQPAQPQAPAPQYHNDAMAADYGLTPHPQSVQQPPAQQAPVQQSAPQMQQPVQQQPAQSIPAQPGQAVQQPNLVQPTGADDIPF